MTGGAKDEPDLTCTMVSYRRMARLRCTRQAATGILTRYTYSLLPHRVKHISADPLFRIRFGMSGQLCPASH